MNLFAYGTLEFPSVMQAVTGSRTGFRSTMAVLHDYRRFRLLGRNYPGIVFYPHGTVTGTLYFDLTQSIFNRICDYEDSCYRAEKVEVVAGDQVWQNVRTFIIPRRSAGVLSREAWQPEDFELSLQQRRALGLHGPVRT